eukprot:3178345-Prymnesium_polylepis.1
MLSRTQTPTHVALADADAGRRSCGGGHSCGKIGNRAFVARHTCAQGISIVAPHLPRPSVMLRLFRNWRSPFSPPPPQS